MPVYRFQRRPDLILIIPACSVTPSPAVLEVVPHFFARSFWTLFRYPGLRPCTVHQPGAARCLLSHPATSVQGHAWRWGQRHLSLCWGHRGWRWVPSGREADAWRRDVAGRHAGGWRWGRVAVVAGRRIRWCHGGRWVRGGWGSRRGCCRRWIHVGVVWWDGWRVAGRHGRVGGAFRLHHGLQALEALPRHVGAAGGHEVVGGRWRGRAVRERGRLLVWWRGVRRRRSGLCGWLSLCRRGWRRGLAFW